jgi:hypothetical protein
MKCKHKVGILGRKPIVEEELDFETASLLNLK